MKQPKIYKKSLNKVFEVESIRFDTKVVEIYDFYFPLFLHI